MDKKILIALVVLIIIAVFMVTFPFFSKKYEIVETKEFSCPGMEGFTFSYPVFKGWEVENVYEGPISGLADERVCTILLHDPAPASKVQKREEPSPRIIIDKNPALGLGKSINFVSHINPSNIMYNPLLREEGEGFVFYSETFGVKIFLLNIPENPGYSRDLFWKTVIESFKFIQPTEKPLNFTVETNLTVNVTKNEVQATLTFANLGPEDAYIDKIQACLNGKTENDVFEITSDNQRISYNGIMTKRGYSKDNIIELGAGKSLTATVKLGEVYNFLSGNHTYKAKYSAYHQLPPFILPLESNDVTFSFDSTDIR